MNKGLEFDQFDVDDPFEGFTGNVDAFATPGKESSGKRLMADVDEIEAVAQVRTHFDEEKVQRFVDNFTERRAAGLEVILSAIQVKELPPEERHGRVRYRIAQGETRWRAAKLAGESQVPIERVKEITPLDQLTENMIRTDLDVVDTADGIAGQIAKGQSQAKVAQMFGIGRSAVVEYKLIAEASECVRGLVRAKRTESRRVLSELAVLYREAPDRVEQWIAAGASEGDRIAREDVARLRMEILPPPPVEPPPENIAPIEEPRAPTQEASGPSADTTRPEIGNADAATQAVDPEPTSAAPAADIVEATAPVPPARDQEAKPAEGQDDAASGETAGAPGMSVPCAPRDDIEHADFGMTGWVDGEAVELVDSTCTVRYADGRCVTVAGHRYVSAPAVQEAGTQGRSEEDG